MSGSLTRFGIGKETTYGTAVAVTKSFEIMSEDFAGMYERVQAEALSGSYVDRADRFSISNKGASGSVTFEPLTKDFGNWLAFMLGQVATTGPVETAAYTHTGTVASLSGKNLTVQVLRADETDTLRPWTYEGGKVTNFEFSNSVDQTLRVQIGMDFEKESNPDAPAGVYAGTALAGIANTANANVFTWQEGTITVGGTAYDLSEVTIGVDNALNTDRYFINASTPGKREPRQDGKREITWSFTSTYADNTFWEKVSSATIAGSYASLSAKWVGLVAIPGTTTPLYPCIEVLIPVARFDEGGPNVDGESQLEQSFSGVGLYDGTNSPISIIYKTQDSTVLT
jgi:tail tube protein